MPKISHKKHSQKKSPGELFPVAFKPVAFTLAATATAEEMFPITGLTDAQLRQIALQKSPTGAPWFPKPALSRYDTVATLRGLMARGAHRASAAATPRLDALSFSTMEACEAATGIAKTLQQLAKSRGCPAFRGSRVYLIELLRWIFHEAATGQTADWGKLNEELDAKLKQVELDTKLGNLRKADEVKTEIRTLASIFFGALRRLRLECPRDFEMRTKAYIKESIDKKHTQITDQITTLIGQKIEETTEQPELQNS